MEFYDETTDEVISEKIEAIQFDLDDFITKTYVVNLYKKGKRSTYTYVLDSKSDIKKTCSICTDENRNKNSICIVENVSDLWALERSGIYKGQYHVLGGVLSAIDGINPDELNIPLLEQKIKKSKDIEIIIAISATLDGQTTAHYLLKLVSKYGNKITKLAHGVPVGGELDYLDDGTITQALKGRILFEQDFN